MCEAGGRRTSEQDGLVPPKSLLVTLFPAIEGQPQKAEQQIQMAARFGENNDHFHHAAFILAAACAEMGKPHEAVVWLSRVAEGGMPNYPLFHDNPSMTKLRGNPEYDQFMADFKLSWDQLASVIGLSG
jgi:hypothetical protein